MSDNMCHNARIEHIEVRQEAKILAELVGKGMVDPSDKTNYPAKLSEFAQGLLRDNPATADARMLELKRELHTLLPSDFPCYSDSLGKRHIADLSKIEETVNLVFTAIERHQGKLSSIMLREINEDLIHAQKVHKDKIPADASLAEIGRDLSQAFVMDFERRSKSSPTLRVYQAYLNKAGHAQIRLRN